jgi:hypothetical protein
MYCINILVVIRLFLVIDVIDRLSVSCPLFVHRKKYDPSSLSNKKAVPSPVSFFASTMVPR